MIAAPVLSRDDAVEKLAEQLAWKQEHLDPSDEGAWENYSERDKEFFRACVKWLLLFPELLEIALSDTAIRSAALKKLQRLGQEYDAD